MNKALSKDIKKYIKEIKENIICDFRTKNKFISDIKNSIDDYIEANHTESVDDIYRHFGKPEEIAKDFLVNANVKKIKRRMNITKVVFFGVLIALIMLAVVYTSAFIDTYKSNRGHYEEEIVDYPEVNIDELEWK